MLLLVTVICLLLAAVFVIAGLAKLRYRARTRADLGELGLPHWALSAGSIGLPAVEIATAALLVIEPLTTLGVACALGLLATFTGVIAINLWRGRRPACACFGALSHARIGAGTLARNILLMAVGGVLLLPPSATPVAYNALLISSTVIFTASLILGCVSVILFLAWWVFQLWRQQGRLLLRIEQLEQLTQHSHQRSASAEASEPISLPRPPEFAGQPAPALTLHDVTGQRIDLASSRGTATVLLFLDSTCRHCQPLLSRLRTWRPAASMAPRMILILVGQQTQAHAFAPGSVVVDGEGPSAMEAFGILGTPSAVAIDSDGVVAEPAARGYAAVAQLLDRLTPQEVQYELATV